MKPRCESCGRFMSSKKSNIVKFKYINNYDNEYCMHAMCFLSEEKDSIPILKNITLDEKSTVKFIRFNIKLIKHESNSILVIGNTTILQLLDILSSLNNDYLTLPDNSKMYSLFNKHLLIMY